MLRFGLPARRGFRPINARSPGRCCSRARSTTIGPLAARRERRSSRMRRSRTLAALVAIAGLTSLPARAELHPAPVQKAPAKTLHQTAPVRGLFWEVHGDKGTAYLLGSIHVANRSMYPLPQEIESAYDRS